MVGPKERFCTAIVLALAQFAAQAHDFSHGESSACTLCKRDKFPNTLALA